MSRKTKVLCDASIEKGQLCVIDGCCNNSGAEYGVTIIAENGEIDYFILCKGCSKKLQQLAEDAGYAVSISKITKSKMRDL